MKDDPEEMAKPTLKCCYCTIDGGCYWKCSLLTTDSDLVKSLTSRKISTKAQQNLNDLIIENH